MDRIKLKEQAQQMIKGNKWYIWKPLVLFELCVFAIAFVIGIIIALAGVEGEALELATSLLSGIAGVIESIFMVGYAKYCLDFVRGNKVESGKEVKEVFGFAMKHFWTIFLVDLLVTLIIFGGMILLVIPGIIFAIGHCFYQEVCVDNIDDSISSIISKSWQLTKGYKVDLFVLGLSFLGWALLVPFTLGILIIWLVPYMTVTFVLAYEELRNK